MDDLGLRTLEDAKRWARLTDKQRACLDLLVERKTSKQIARALNIAKVTVDQRIRAARDILGAPNRDEAAIIYARLKPIYDRMIYDPVDLPPTLTTVPSIDTNGSKPAASTPSNRMATMGETSRKHSPFKDLWRHDHRSSNVIIITAIVAVALAIFALTALGIAQALTQLISG
ncbi:helix-turn-helix domain-containing protein [Sphingopyxis witflariensis]|uniref:Helix-turn-helix transcriptional regulator n=1 Tax=Sphingopyxis witflariensis TaxID=173675 RepID=A0A246K5G7_9SPHN|nr:helix-turn-helix transcriptional regulator [Sphingopyxis witflariensis]OWR01242.1 helix-turn-helix transcriptional regulator [Sphingopyxis witflariensis]